MAIFQPMRVVGGAAVRGKPMAYSSSSMAGVTTSFFLRSLSSIMHARWYVVGRSSSSTK
jgi:hypothetical protein